MKTKPTDKQLADNAGLTLEAYQAVKHITLDQMVALAHLQGATLGIGLVPREKLKAEAKKK